MRRPNYLFASLIGIVPGLLFLGTLAAQTPAPSKPLPALKTRATPKAVVEEHMDALNHCDWTRLMAQYPDNVEFFFPESAVISGRAKAAGVFAGFVKPPAQGGVCGYKFTAEYVSQVGDTVNVQWVVTSDTLAAPYRGSDAFVTKNGLIAAQMSTFDGTKLKKKK